MASRKTLVHETLTDSIDDQIAQLRNKRTELNRAADALVAADAGVAEARAALKSAEQTLATRRAEIVALGVKPREISRILKQMRDTTTAQSADASTPAGDSSNAEDDGSGDPDPATPPARMSDGSHTHEGSETTNSSVV